MTEYLDILIYTSLGLNLILIFWLIRTEIRLRKFFKGKNAQSLESLIDEALKKSDSFENFQTEITKGISILNEKIATSIRGIGLVRFNPFKGKGLGGDQSFAIALIDADGKGLVLSSLHSRERVSTYAKPLEKFKSKYDLTNEEKEAIEIARKQI